MAHDEEADASPPEADDVPQPGPRRSTFTPAPPDAYRAIFGAGADQTSVPRDAPPPNPATVVTPPAGSEFPAPPQRRSLADDELLTALGDGRESSALEAIEELEQQLLIRRQEAKEFTSWESSMRAIGTQEALEVVEEVRTTFTEAIQVIPPFESEPAQRSEAPAVVYDLVEPEDPPRTEGGTVISPSNAQRDPVEPQQQDVGGTNREPAFTPETAGAEPTVLAARTAGSFRLFWLWFAVNSSALSVVLGAVLLAMGMSLRQAVLATLGGVALSFLPTGLATLAAKWTGQPTMIVSRATFGLAGNVVPATLAVIARVFWAGALLWFLASVGSTLLVELGAADASDRSQLSIVITGSGVLLATTVAFFGHRLLAWVQLLFSVVSGALIVGLVATTWPLIHTANALSVRDGSWILVITGTILVFSFIGLAWASGAGDLARYQRQAGSGARAMLAASFGSAIPPFVLIGYGAALAASDPELAHGFIVNPAATLVTVVPAWFQLPLVVAVMLGLLSGTTVSMYSGAFSAQALGLRMRRDVAVLAIGAAVGAVAVAITATGLDLQGVFRDLATSLGVPTAAWLGLYAAEIMIRNRRVHSASLLQAGGAYAKVRWVNVAMLLAATGVGYGLTTASVDWLAWQGYLMPLLGWSEGGELADSDIGVIVALAVGLLTPVVAGISAIRRQESSPAASVD